MAGCPGRLITRAQAETKLPSHRKHGSTQRLARNGTRRKTRGLRSLKRTWAQLAKERLEDTRPTIPLGKSFWPLPDDERHEIELVLRRKRRGGSQPRHERRGRGPTS